VTRLRAIWVARLQVPSTGAGSRRIPPFDMSKGTLNAIEMAILKGLANGLQSKEIAVILDRSTATIELHVRILFARFDARSRAHLVACALCSGTIDRKDIDGVDDHQFA
jgi:DNA-binding NarL/FixJ family response regulator